MLIGIDASRANKPHKTGTEWYSFYLIREFAQLDNKNQYILYTDTPLIGCLEDLVAGSLDCNYCLEPKFDSKGYQIVTSPHNNFKAKVLRWPFSFFWTQGRLALEMLIASPDVLFVPAHTLPFIHPKKSVVTIHDVGFERERKLFSRDELGPTSRRGRWLLNLLVKIFTRGKFGANSLDYLSWSTQFALKKASTVIVPSNFTRQELISIYKVKGDNIKVVHNGYNDKLYRVIKDKKAIQAVLAKYGLEQPFFMYVGRIERKKNIPALMEAFGILKQSYPEIKHKLLLVGDASYGFDEAKYIMHEYGVEREVYLPGWLPEGDMPYLYNAASAFVFPSRYEGFGIPLLQAMACGVPVVAAQAASIPEVVGEAALLFNPKQVEDIVKALYKIATDKALHTDLRAKGLERVKKFSWRKSAAQTLQIIQSLTAKEV